MSRFCPVCGFLLKGSEIKCPECDAQLIVVSDSLIGVNKDDKLDVSYDTNKKSLDFDSMEKRGEPFPWLIFSVGLILLLVSGVFFIFKMVH